MEENHKTNRREFLKTFSLLAGTSLIATQMPWLSTASAQDVDRPVRLGIIGVGSRASYHLIFLKQIPGLKITSFCDIYDPNFKSAREKIGPEATGYKDYREMLAKENLDAVLIATPLDRHARMTIDALKAGLHVFCEKSMALTIEDSNDMARAALDTGKILQIGHQRMFSLIYQQAFQKIREGKLGDITQIRAYWHRNSDWRRPVPSPEYERLINWRLYHDYSRGLMTELASHQVQVGNQILGMPPEMVWGSGGINYWNDGREVFDNVNLVYKYPNGTHMIYDSIASNRHYGLEEQIMGPKGTMELENNRMWDEFPPPAPGFLQLINNLEHKFFDAVPIGGASWVPETAVNADGRTISDEVMEDDGTRMSLEAFVANVRDNRVDLELTRQGLYATVAVLMGFNSIMENKIMYWPKNLVL
ncbi:MAG TPA: Gfo/Idh/MocA family oxidoreductase [Bacteroidales bacterium]|nr:Gfo/Idh/MocA family oxidoreductase [Bacteroidales bacterium]